VTFEQRPFAGAKGDCKAIHADLRTLSNTFGLIFGAVRSQAVMAAAQDEDTAAGSRQSVARRW
jgi:hypothetical protein